MGAGNVEQGCRQNVIAHQHGHLVIVSGVHAGLTSALAALINHVIMNETCRVEQLQTYGRMLRDRKSTRLNSSHANISYAVFCLKKKMSLTPSLDMPRS